MMHDNPGSGSHDAAASVLRRLALRANGMSGADVERVIRQARQKARRAGRPLSWDDLEALLAARRPKQPEELRRHMAVHEAGHAIARLVYRLGRIRMITIDGPSGSGYVQTEMLPFAENEEGLTCSLVVLLAGRAAEEAVVGSALAGSGNGQESDLARATELAARMELAFGYGRSLPLLYRPPSDRSALLCYQPEIARQVDARLAAAYDRARALIEANRAPLETVAETLLVADTLEGGELEALIAAIKPRLMVPDAGPHA